MAAGDLQELRSEGDVDEVVGRRKVRTAPRMRVDEGRDVAVLGD